MSSPRIDLIFVEQQHLQRVSQRYSKPSLMTYNKFASSTVFTTYGGFNFSYGALYLPQIGLAWVSSMYCGWNSC